MPHHSGPCLSAPATASSTTRQEYLDLVLHKRQLQLRPRLWLRLRKCAQLDQQQQQQEKVVFSGATPRRCESTQRRRAGGMLGRTGAAAAQRSGPAVCPRLGRQATTAGHVPRSDSDSDSDSEQSRATGAGGENGIDHN
jgi:hypothetical protein